MIISNGDEGNVLFPIDSTGAKFLEFEIAGKCLFDRAVNEQQNVSEISWLTSVFEIVVLLILILSSFAEG